MSHWIRGAVGGVVFVMSAASLFAGGSGLNVVVLVNTNSANSLELGNYYCEQRGVPPQNVLRIGWTGNVKAWALTNLDAVVRAPLTAMLTSRQLSNQVEFILLSMDIPYRVIHTTGSTPSSGVNSTTSALFYGFHPDDCTSCPADFPSCNLPDSSSNSYAGSEGIVRNTPPISASSNSWLAMMLTANDLAQAKAVIDGAVAADYSFPTQTVYLIHYEPDPFRGVRHYQYDDAIFENQVRGLARVVRVEVVTPGATPSTFGYQLGSQYGLSAFNLPAGLFAPGALADNLTSYGGLLFDNAGHTTALQYLNAGAAASYGTVAEPCNYLEKFPSPRNYFYQARGFNAAECYYQSLTNPYQGILVGEPLCAPFARPAEGDWSNLPLNAVLTGITNLSVEFNAPDASRAVGQVDLFVDGTFAVTLTNLAPRQGNQIEVTLNGHPTNYTIPANATLQSVTTDLAARLNHPAFRNVTKVAAFAHGDRIELRSLELAKRGDELSVGVTSQIGSASFLTVGLLASRTNFLDTPATGLTNFVVTNAVSPGDFLELTVTKTNGGITSVSVTNPPGNTNTSVLVSNLVNAVNTHPELTAADGVVAVDFFSHNQFFEKQAGEFNLRPRSPGWLEAQITASLTAPANLTVTPAGTRRLDANDADLQPRNHLYVTAGLTNLAFSFGFNTTTQADGFHELTTVAYEGSHVRTQKRVSQAVRIQNSSMSAVFNCLLCDTNTALEATLQFSVAANTNIISRIELFSTGGSRGVVSNQSTATFSLAATNLGPGLHPFYALVLRNDGQQYRTETKWIRITSNDTPFPLAVVGRAPDIIWPATAGRRYEVLSATNVLDAFVLRDSVVPTNSPGRWTETNSSAPQRFYRVQSTP